MVDAPRPDEHDGILDLIVEQQAVPARRVAAVGLDAVGIAGELAEFEPPWASTVRVERRDGALIGACGIEWDQDLGRAWVIGPWVRADGDAWQHTARSLVDGVLAQLPEAITRIDLGIEAAAHELAALAEGLGWKAGECNIVLVADVEVVSAWSGRSSGATVRPAAAADAPVIRPLHDAEFPATYASADQLVLEGIAGERTTLVAVTAQGHLAGYASGEVHGDGEAYIDFIGVVPDARRNGVGRALAQALVSQLIAAAPLGRVALTVQEHRTGARALYEELGFRPDGAIVGYRSS